MLVHKVIRDSRVSREYKEYKADKVGKAPGYRVRKDGKDHRLRAVIRAIKVE